MLSPNRLETSVGNLGVRDRWRDTTAKISVHHLGRRLELLLM